MSTHDCVILVQSYTLFGHRNILKESPGFKVKSHFDIIDPNWIVYVDIIVFTEE